MKHLRKLLCMLLAIIMIVEVVPMWSVAEAIDNVIELEQTEIEESEEEQEQETAQEKNDNVVNEEISAPETNAEENEADTTEDEITVIDSGNCGAEGDGSNLEWTLDSKGTLTISGTGKMKDYGSERPSWREYANRLKKLVIDEGVTSIGNDAFCYCSGFTGDLIIPEGVTSIGSSAFSDCSGFTGNLVIPEGVTSIGSYAFYDCSGFTGNLVIPEGVTSIGRSVFNGCSGFTGNLVIPEGVTSIGDYAFYYCSKIERICFRGNAPKIEKNSFATEKTLYYVKGKSGWTSPKWNGYNTGIWNPKTNEFFVDYGYCGAEDDEKNLTWIIYEDGTFVISGTGKMKNYDTKHVNGKWITTTPWNEYADRLKKLVIDEGVTSIGSSAFNSCSGFKGNLVIPKGVTSIGDYAFRGCSGFTGNLVIPEGVTSIGDYAFSGCSGFTGNLVIPEGVTFIGYYAFYNCSGFTGNLVIPEGVTSIGDYAFYYCSKIERICFRGNAPKIEKNSFATEKTLYYVKGKSGWTSPKWNGYNTGIWDPETNEFSIAFGYCGTEGDEKNLTWILYEDGTLVISGTGKMEDYTFENNATTAPWGEYTDKIKELVIDENITSIGSYAFYACNQLVGDLIIPDSIISIGDYAFAGCDRFTGTLKIGNSVASIGKGAFSECGGFTGDLTIPNSVTTIGDYAFCNCYGFSGNLTISNRVKTIGEDVFRNCCNLKGNLVIPNGVTEIKNGAFSGCDSFYDDLVLPDSVETIGDNAFNSNNSFGGGLSLGDNVTNIGKNSFPNFEKIYFKGDAPTVYSADNISHSFDAKATLYYTKNKSGWTSPTWNGYNTATWSGNEDRIPGDINDDGKVDIRDAIRLAKYLAKENVEINLSNANVNGDDKVDVRDLIRLKKYLAKMPVELI